MTARQQKTSSGDRGSPRAGSQVAPCDLSGHPANLGGHQEPELCSIHKPQHKAGGTQGGEGAAWPRGIHLKGANRRQMLGRGRGAARREGPRSIWVGGLAGAGGVTAPGRLGNPSTFAEKIIFSSGCPEYPQGELMVNVSPRHTGSGAAPSAAGGAGVAPPTTTTLSRHQAGPLGSTNWENPAAKHGRIRPAQLSIPPPAAFRPRASGSGARRRGGKPERCCGNW